MEMNIPGKPAVHKHPCLAQRALKFVRSTHYNVRLALCESVPYVGGRCAHAT